MVAKLTTIDGFIAEVRSLPEMTERVVTDTVNFYGDKILIRHFQYGNSTAYNMPKLSPEYARQKARRVGLQPILVRSGRAKVRIVGSARAKRLSPKEVRLTIRAPQYMIYHLNGSGRLPVRNWLYPNKRDMKDIIRYARKRVRAVRKSRSR
jgi:hypothetical protein